MNVHLKKAVLENWPIKLISLGLAVTLWFYVTSKGKTEMALTIPLEIRNTPKHLAVVGEVPGYVDVRIQGQERALRNITTGKKVFGIIDLSSARVGENVVPLSPEDIKRPSGVTVSRIAPFEVRVKLEPIERKTCRLKAVLRGAPAQGYRIAGVSINPPKVTVEGPRGVMRSLTSLDTMPIEMAGARESFTVVTRVDYGGRPIRILENSISTKITIQKVR